jgi:hypothetical protein
VAAIGTLAVVAGVVALRPWRQPRAARVLT